MGALSRALSEARAAGGAFSAWLERAAGGGGGGGGRGRGRGGNEGGGGDDGDGDDPLGLSGNAVYSFANKASTNGGAAAAAASLGEFEAERDASAALTAALQRAAGGGLWMEERERKSRVFSSAFSYQSFQLPFLLLRLHDDNNNNNKTHTFPL
jgi:hypothetical protein